MTEIKSEVFDEETIKITRNFEEVEYIKKSHLEERKLGYERKIEEINGLLSKFSVQA